MARDSGKQSQTTTLQEPIEEQIRQRAYELYEERGREDGHDVDDWLRAKDEITAKKSLTIAA